MQNNNFKLRIRLPHHRICTEQITDFTADRQKLRVAAIILYRKLVIQRITYTVF